MSMNITETERQPFPACTIEERSEAIHLANALSELGSHEDDRTMYKDPSLHVRIALWNLKCLNLRIP